MKLDTTIYRDVDRLKHVEQVLDALDHEPTSAELEWMASYIMYGKDENGLNAIQRGEVKDYETKRHKDFKTGDDKTRSLEQLLEDPLTNAQQFKQYDSKRVYIQKKRTIERPVYDKKGNMIKVGDSDIPGMKELWARIDQLDHTIAANEGKLEFNPDDTVFTDEGRLAAFKHMVIDVKRHQYYLKDFYKPTMSAYTQNQSPPPSMRWDTDTYYWISYDEWRARIEKNCNPLISSDLSTYETRKDEEGNLQIKWMVARHEFNWENEWHIRQLIKHYAAIYMETYDKINSWGRALIFDFDRYFDLCGFTELREYVLTRFIDGANLSTIVSDVNAKYGVLYSNGAISDIVNKEIPKRIADYAMKERLMRETSDENRKLCSSCQRYLPASNLFFVTNRRKSHGLQSWCKECDRKYRILKGFQGEVDARYKDKTMPKMPPVKKYY